MALQGKNVFLTGGAQGIGKAMTEVLLREGAKVLFCDVNDTAGKATETELQQQFGDKVSFKRCDLTDKAQLSETFQAAVQTLGAVDVCVNNAGLANESIWETMIVVNMNAQIQGSFLAYEHMRKDKGGRGGIIINTASMSGFVFGSHRNPVYTATKHAMVAFTTCWANNPEMGVQGVRWGVLCPTAVQTKLLALREGMIHDYEGWKKTLTPHDRLQPADVAESLLTFLQNEGSNGAVMKVAREDGRPFHQLLVMDKANTPPMGFIEQEKVFLRKNQ